MLLMLSLGRRIVSKPIHLVAGCTGPGCEEGMKQNPRDKVLQEGAGAAI